MSTNILLY